MPEKKLTVRLLVCKYHSKIDCVHDSLITTCADVAGGAKWPLCFPEQLRTGVANLSILGLLEF